MMLKAMLLAMLATVLVAETSARVLRPKVRDYDEMTMPNFNVTYDNGVPEKVLNISVYYALSDGYYWADFGETVEKAEENWSNTTTPVNYPASFVMLLAQYGYVEDGENKTENNAILVDASQNQYSLNTFMKLSDDDEEFFIEDFFANMTLDKVELTMLENPEEAQDRLDTNEGAKKVFLKKLSEIFAEYARAFLNEPFKRDETESVQKLGSAAVRRQLKRGPLQHIRLPKLPKF